MEINFVIRAELFLDGQYCKRKRHTNLCSYCVSEKDSLNPKKSSKPELPNG
jgi:hypothetical protein